MVQIWLMDTYPYGDPRLPHHCFPPQRLNPDELTKKSGALYYKLDLDDPVACSKRLKLMKIERSFNREDTYTLDAQATIDFEDKIADSFKEREYGQDTARMVIEGAAYFDIETTDERWIRIMVEYGDLVIIPAGRMHRMTTTPKNFVKLRRFFKEDEN
ncbi:Protein K07E1.1 [Aphelenchoides avenae]|nr:Protein K07E1.1 [Aphelenchus avenae]